MIVLNAPGGHVFGLCLGLQALLVGLGLEASWGQLTMSLTFALFYKPSVLVLALEVVLGCGVEHEAFLVMFCCAVHTVLMFDCGYASLK